MLLSASLLSFLVLVHPTNGHTRRALLSGTADNLEASYVPASRRKLGSSSTRLGDPDIISEVQRRLQIQTVSEFCSDLSEIELYITTRLEEFYNFTDFLTEDGGSVCSCMAEGNDVDIACGVFYYSPDANGTIYSSDHDYMQLKLDDDSGIYKPTSVGWRTHFDGSYFGPVYREDYMLNSTDPTKVESCRITDSNCGAESECTVCEGGQTFSIVSGCDNSTNLPCEEGYTGAFMFEYHMLSPIEMMEDEDIECAYAPTVDEFCADLSEIEFTITEAFRNSLPDLDATPYMCNCTIEEEAFAVLCTNSYVDTATNVNYVGREAMVFNEENGRMIPNQMQWCGINSDETGDVYCQSFLFALHQDELSYCEVVGECGAAFCELCSDGFTFADSCEGGPTCSDSVPGAFLFAYKDTVVAIEQCPPTEAPVGTPTMAPVGSPVDTPPTLPPNNPEPTLPPQNEPTENPDREDSSALRLTGSILSIICSLSIVVVQIVC